MAFTVQKLAKMSGVSVRTLHYYDEIGLLKPAYHGENGYRYYEEEQQLALQQILFFRELGFALKRIKRILGRSDFDTVIALKSHRAVLRNEVDRIQGLIETIDKTIQHLQGETVMEGQEMYEGFSKEKQAEYEQQLIDRFGDRARTGIAESKERTKGWKNEDRAKAKREADALNQRFALAMEKELPTDSDEVQALVAEHYKWIEQFWTPDRQAYIDLGKLYTDHAEFREFYEKVCPGFADFLAKAMEIYAERELS